MPVSEALLNQVRQIAADVLVLEVDEVRRESQWESDLDGESIELLDLSFRLDRHFGVRIRFPDVDPADLKFDERNCLTSDSLERLAARFPYLDLATISGRSIRKKLDLLTIAGIAGVVEHFLNTSPSSPAAASSNGTPHGNRPAAHQVSN